VEVTVATPAACLAKISLSVPRDEFDNEVSKNLHRVRKTTRMKGFRPGKTPLATIEKAYGPSVREETKQHFVRLAFQRAVESEDLKPFGEPRITKEDLEAVEMPAGADFAFEFETVLRPTFELGEYKGLTIESRVPEVSDEDVQAAIEEFKKRQSRPEPAGDDGLGEDGLAICKVELVHEDEVVLEREGWRLGLETALPGIDEDAWKEGLRGAAEGSTVELDIVLPEELEKEAARGQQGTCRVTLTQVFRLVPPTDEELQQILGAEDQDGVLQKAREQLEAAARSQEEARIEAELFDRVLDAHGFELPESMVADQVATRLAELRESLESQEGITPEDVESGMQSGEAEARATAEKSVRAFFVLEAIAQKESLLVTDEEVLAEFRRIAERNQASVEEVTEFYRENNQIQQLAIEILERKVRRFLRSEAEIVAAAD